MTNGEESGLLDRAGVASLAAITSLVTGGLVWWGVSYALRFTDASVPLWPVWLFVAAMTALGFRLRENLLARCFGGAWRWLLRLFSIA